MVTSVVKKRSVVIDGQKTSVSLEDEFWDRLREISIEADVPLTKFITAVAKRRDRGQGVSSALRVACLEARK